MHGRHGIIVFSVAAALLYQRPFPLSAPTEPGRWYQSLGFARGRPTNPARHTSGPARWKGHRAGPLVLLLTVAYLWLLGGTMPRAVPAIGGPFTLTQDNGKTVTHRDFRGRYLLIYFGHTSCPDIRPRTLTAIADATDILGNRAKLLQPVWITVDPERDTAAVLHD